MPTTDTDNQQVEDIYQEIEPATPKKEPLIILGNFNANVGKPVKTTTYRIS